MLVGAMDRQLYLASQELLESFERLGQCMKGFGLIDRPLLRLRARFCILVLSNFQFARPAFPQGICLRHPSACNSLCLLQSLTWTSGWMLAISFWLGY